MFGWWGRVVMRVRWVVLLASVAFVALGVGWGTGIFGSLKGGGFDDPNSESSRAYARISQVFGPLGDDVVVLYSSPAATADEPGLADPVRAVLAALEGRPEVVEVMSTYTRQSPEFVSADGHATYIGLRLRPGAEDAKVADLTALEPLLTAGGDVRTDIGGGYAFLRDANKQIERDIIRAELLSMPVLLVLLLFIFRGLVAAFTPLVVGIVAILGGFVVTRIVAGFTDVSVFAANVITLLGLGMAIDYALFVVSRFREELAAGHPTPVAIENMMRTAGRTVVVSGLTVTLALSSLLLFPMEFLKSIGYGAMAAVLVAMLAALTTLPALLAVLGPRINSLRVPPRSARSERQRAPQSRANEALPMRREQQAGAGAWDRLARSVMRRPVLYVVVVAAVLLGLATPFLRAQFGGFDERVLPVGTESRTVAERIAAEFSGGAVAPVLAVVSDASAQQAQAFAQQASNLPNVTGATVTKSNGETSIVTILYSGEPTSTVARDVVREVRALPPPEGGEVLVGGRSAADLDQIGGLVGRLWLMALYVFVVTFLLLFLAFGSMVLPIKAIIMNVISIGASFGVVVWIFQDGHLSDTMGFTPTGFLEPTNLVLMLAVLFGLSTDYEVFLLSRIREEYQRIGDNTEAVATGLQRTGGIITAAALLLIVVVAGFATGGATTLKMLGVGTVVAVALDAALVRTLLVPATMRLLGRWNWWAPEPFARVYRRFGLRDSDTEPTTKPESVPV
jgi:RND superfamily putative drug exporter